jgi:hypothetical protein
VEATREIRSRVEHAVVPRHEGRHRDRYRDRLAPENGGEIGGVDQRRDERLRDEDERVLESQRVHGLAAGEERCE